MRIHRGFLFWGIFFVLLGGLPLADRLGWIDAQQLGQVWRLWPLAIIAVGVAIILSRSHVAVLGSVFMAVVLGGLAGGALAYGGGWIFDFGDCVPGDRANLQHTSRSGAFTGAASVDLSLSCGTLDLATAPGTTWSLAASHRGEPPAVDATAANLSIRNPEGGPRRQEWALIVPTDQLRDLDVQTNAAQSTLNVSGAQLASLDLQANAGDVRVIADGASISDLDVKVNAGRVRLTLGGTVAGSLHANAGSIDVCVPPDANLRLDVQEQFAFSTNLADRGLARTGTTWTRTGLAGPTIQLDVEGNAATFKLNPSGGCR